MITLHVEPGQAPMTFEEFKTKVGGSAVALDGYVAEGPRVDLLARVANFNHHEGVSRLETRATCAQVLLAVRQGFFRRFTGTVHVYVNDCDEDVCLSVFLMRYPHLCQGVINPLLNRLVAMEDMLDSTAGSYAYPPEMKSLQTLAWIFAPYHQVRKSGLLASRDAALFAGVITDVENRILSYISGNAQSLELDAQFERLGEVGGVVFVRETGAHARAGMFAAGITSYISVRPHGKDRLAVTAGKASMFEGFDLEKFVLLANAREQLENSADKWGGGSLVIGSPRIAGTGLELEILKELCAACAM